VHRRVEVGAAVLGGGEAFRCVPVAALGHALGNGLDAEAFGRGPVDGVGVERMREVDPFAAVRVVGAGRRGAAANAGDRHEREQQQQ
jgi:hypothetical protein